MLDVEEWKVWKEMTECKTFTHLYHFQKCLVMQLIYVLKLKVEVLTQWNLLIMKKCQNQF